MAVQHPPPPGGGPGPGTGPGDRGAVGSAPEEAAAAGEPPKPADTAVPVRRPGDGPAGQVGASGSAGRGRRLLPSGPALEHAPLLLGLDAAGGEHPQGGEHPDDEDLVGRVWGCVCGWRSTVRDVSTRPFHPRVGDGGGLRRQRLARSDRDTRAEVEAHLAQSSSASADRPALVGHAPAPSNAGTSLEAEASRQRENVRPRGRRRRLTVPREPPLAIPTVMATPAAHEAADEERDAPSRDDAVAESTIEPDEPKAPNAARSWPETSAAQVALTHSEPAAPGEHAGVRGQASAELLENAVARAEAARRELAEAKSALDAAVAAAREDGLSWRTIGRATRLGHQEAATRWSPSGRGCSR